MEARRDCRLLVPLTESNELFGVRVGELDLVGRHATFCNGISQTQPIGKPIVHRCGGAARGKVREEGVNARIGHINLT